MRDCFKYCVLVISSLLFVSCEVPIDLHLQGLNEQLLFVDGSMTTDSIKQFVIMKKTKDYVSDNNFEPETDADVKILELKDNVVQRIFSLQYSSTNLWYETDSMIKGIPGMTYRLQIKVGDKEITAEELLKPIVNLDLVGFIRVINPETGDTLFAVAASYKEPEATTDDAYVWDYYYNNEYKSDTLRNKDFENDDYFNGKDFKTRMVLAPNKFRKGRKEPQYLKQGDVVMLQISTVNQKYYEYVSQVFQLIYQGTLPFAGPAANPKGNLLLNGKSQGVYGYFSTKSISRKSVIFDTAIIPPPIPVIY